MAEEETKSHGHETAAADEAPVDAKDRGLFDFVGKKEEVKPQEEAMASEFEEKVQVSKTEPKTEEVKKEEEKSGGLVQKLDRSGSSSSSTSDEEEGEGEEKKKKKKKGLKEKLKEKLSGDTKGEDEKKQEESTAVPVDVVHSETPLQAEEKKGFLEKIKEKVPGQKKAEEVPPTPPVASSVEAPSSEAVAHEGEAKEKKGILEKIKEKLPGYHSKTQEDKEKEGDRSVST